MSSPPEDVPPSTQASVRPPAWPGLLVLCAWCGKSIARPTGPILKISHGICQPCKETVLATMSEDAA